MLGKLVDLTLLKDWVLSVYHDSGGVAIVKRERVSPDNCAVYFVGDGSRAKEKNDYVKSVVESAKGNVQA